VEPGPYPQRFLSTQCLFEKLTPQRVRRARACITCHAMDFTAGVRVGCRFNPFPTTALAASQDSPAPPFGHGTQTRAVAFLDGRFDTAPRPFSWAPMRTQAPICMLPEIVTSRLAPPKLNWITLPHRAKGLASPASHSRSRIGRLQRGVALFAPNDRQIRPQRERALCSIFFCTSA